jgi:hypothetical protein
MALHAKNSGVAMKAGLQSVCVCVLQVERQRREHCRGACFPWKILKFRASETPFRAFWGENLQNSEDYNIIIRSRMPASSVILDR